LAEDCAKEIGGMGQGGGWRGRLKEDKPSEDFIREFSDMYSKIETNDEGDISMRNVITHIQIQEAEKWLLFQTNHNYQHSGCGILSFY